MVVAHRGPVTFIEANGRRVAERNGGGLVTALRDIIRNVEGTRFLCAANSEADRAVASLGWYPVPFDGSTCLVRMLDIEPDAHHGFYGVIANPLLWFVQHYLWSQATAPDIGPREVNAWEHGYRAVNERFAATLTDPNDAPLGSVVMVHDYHFYLVPGLLRRQRPDLFVHFFVHIPWPQPDSWRALPLSWRAEIFRGLLGSDIVGFHTERYARNFLLGCSELLGLDVDFPESAVYVDGRRVAVRWYPISVDESTLQQLSDTPEAARYETELLARKPDHLIVRVDRTDPAKNIVRGFRAFDRMLERHPELAGRVQFLALLQPSRQDVPEYVDYLAEINATVAAINGRRQRPGWLPIDLRLGDNLPLAVAAYRCFDVLMVNSVFDGMNLVSKEALVLNDTGGVLALSENTGAYEELGAVAVTLHPFDIEQQAGALHTALMLPREERARRQRTGVEIVRTNNVQEWLRRQLADIELMRGERVSLHAPARAVG